MQFFLVDNRTYEILIWANVRLALAILCLAYLVVPGRAAAQTDQAQFFEKSVRPLMAKHCFRCHGPKTEKSGLRLHTADRLFQGGHTGPVVVPGKPDESRFIQLIRGIGELRMPPDAELPDSEIAILEQWIRDGAVWPEYPLQPKAVPDDPDESTSFTSGELAYWAFQPVQPPQPPTVNDESWIESPIDRFILAKLEAAGLAPSPPADKYQLLRRVTFDLTGLPPTAEEIADFLADESPEAFTTVVDRLLESPGYGERWGRHWLDVVRYGESAAHDGNNAYLHAWRYRDYVIKAFNDDKPYDRFIIEQLAGDLLPKTNDVALDYEQLVATGFLQVGPKPVVMRDKRQMLLDIADEQLHTSGVAFLGLTIGCARCHDHKFDPIPTKDYYSLAGIFASTRVMRDHVADSMWIETEVPGPDGQPAKLMTVRDFPNPRDLRIHHRGSYRTLGGIAPRRFLQVIAGVDHQPIQAEGSGRLELAQWIASPQNPLTPRVMVNRIWQHHFGRGIVSTSDNFGLQGEQPTHPQLLDWLAAQFVENGWSIKAIHRWMVVSSTYRQAYVENEAHLAADPENKWLWRMRRRRLDAEQIRDAMLAASGELDLTEGGTLFTEGYTANDAQRELYVVDISGKEYFPPFQHPRRSVYLPVIRNGRPEMLKLFDVANSHESTSLRGETTVAPQMLFLLNSRFARSQAKNLALRVVDAAPTVGSPQEQIAAQVQSAYHWILGRAANTSDLSRAEEFLSKYQKLASQLDMQQLVAHEEETASNSAYADLVYREDSLVAYYQLPGIELNGMDQQLVFSADQALNSARQAISVECWVKPEDVRQYMTIVGRDSSQKRYWKLGVYGMEVAGQRRNVVFSEFFGGTLGGHRLNVEESLVAPVGQWTHVALTYGEGQRRLYVNGRVVDEVEASGEVPTGDVPLTLGSRHPDSELFRGAVNHVAIYQTALDRATISRHYRAFRRANGRTMDSTELFAWQSFCQSLFCLNEFIYLE
ncbi:MAG: DUF1553 domain-containing protein [Pirellulaceae bacterium]|nr:DUF1553 domain-containing protein [Pirellulaceae bacterium]